ncbi:MAG: hypothetical protein ABIG03_05970 [Candidatus Eisenbacteria bacterium]
MRALTIVLALALVAMASVASADFIWFTGVGNGDFMDSPPTFIGGMEAPGDILDGSWTITVPDAGWPTDPVARQSYIWNTFYAPNYEPGTPGFWKGYFDATTNGEQNALAIVDNTNVGTMGGVTTLEIQVQDLNSNGVLDEGEFCDGSHTGIIIIIRDGTGVYDGWCGTGNFYGSYVVNCPDTYETWNFGMYLWISDCSTPVESTTWGSIKALYQ